MWFYPKTWDATALWCLRGPHYAHGFHKNVTNKLFDVVFRSSDYFVTLILRAFIIYIVVKMTNYCRHFLCENLS